MADLTKKMRHSTAEIDETIDKVGELETALDSKVNKEEGKSLIADSEIERLAGVENYDDTAVKADISAIQSAYQLVTPKTFKFYAYNDTQVATKYFKLFSYGFTAANVDFTFKAAVIGSYSSISGIPYREYIARGRKAGGNSYPVAIVDEIYTSKTINTTETYRDAEIVFTYNNETFETNCYLKVTNRFQMAEAIIEMLSATLARLDQITLYCEPNAVISQYIESIPATETEFTML